MTLCCVADEGEGKAIIGPLEHVKCFSKCEVAHYVEGEVIAPISHVLCGAPFGFYVAVGNGCCIFCAAAEFVTEYLDWKFKQSA